MKLNLPYKEILFLRLLNSFLISICIYKPFLTVDLFNIWSLLFYLTKDIFEWLLWVFIKRILFIFDEDLIIFNIRKNSWGYFEYLWAKSELSLLPQMIKNMFFKDCIKTVYFFQNLISDSNSASKNTFRNRQLKYKSILDKKFFFWKLGFFNL